MIKNVGAEHDDFRVAAWTLAGLRLMDSRPQDAAELLDAVFACGKDPSADTFINKYVSARLTLTVAAGVTAELPVNRDAVGLALAELKQEKGDVDGAISVVEQLEPTTYAAVSLAELYAISKRWSDVVEITDSIKNEDDATALLLCFRGIALREQGFMGAAHEAFKEALRRRTQPPEIRHKALIERAANYVTQGKRSMARKDLERILAEDATYQGVREKLEELTG